MINKNENEMKKKTLSDESLATITPRIIITAKFTRVCFVYCYEQQPQLESKSSCHHLILNIKLSCNRPTTTRGHVYFHIINVLCSMIIWKYMCPINPNYHYQCISILSIEHRTLTQLVNTDKGPPWPGQGAEIG